MMRVALMFKLIGGLLAAGAVLGLAGCDPFAVHKIKEGQTTEAQVRKGMGKPTMEWQEGFGVRTLEYSGQPQGSTNYMITIDANGTVSRLRQVLTVENFALIQPGMTLDQTRRLLGQPAKQVWYGLKQENEVDWRFQSSPTETALFTVVTDQNERIKRTYTGPDFERSNMYRGR